jgi:hypothetical protein
MLSFTIRDGNKMTNLSGIYHVVKVDHYQEISNGETPTTG